MFSKLSFRIFLYILICKFKQVEVITLKNFEETFGFDDTMEWE